MMKHVLKSLMSLLCVLALLAGMVSAVSVSAASGKYVIPKKAVSVDEDGKKYTYSYTYNKSKKSLSVKTTEGFLALYKPETVNEQNVVTLMGGYGPMVVATNPAVKSGKIKKLSESFKSLQDVYTVTRNSKGQVSKVSYKYTNSKLPKYNSNTTVSIAYDSDGNITKVKVSTKMVNTGEWSKTTRTFQYVLGRLTSCTVSSSNDGTDLSEESYYCILDLGGRVKRTTKDLSMSYDYNSDGSAEQLGEEYELKYNSKGYISKASPLMVIDAEGDYAYTTIKFTYTTIS